MSIPITTDQVWVVNRGPDVGRLVGLIFDPDRAHPVIVVSTATDTDSPRVNPGDLLDELTDQGLIVHLAALAAAAVSEQLSDTVGDAFRAYGGAIRVIWPGATSRDHWRRHATFLTFPQDDPTDTIAAIARYLRSSAPRRRPTGSEAPSSRPIPAGVTPLVLARPGQRPEPRREDEHTVDEALSPVVSHLETSTASEDGPSTQDISAREQRLVDVVDQAVRSAIQDLLGGPGDTSDALDRERSRADAAEQELDALRQRHEATQERLEASLRSAGGSSRVFADPGDQLRYEIAHAWLVQTPESDRPQKKDNELIPAPPAFTLGPRMVESMEVPMIRELRSKVIDVIVDVLNGTVHQRRTTHQYESGGKPLVRDGDLCWRAYVKNNSPSAARLMWWQLTDGTVELAAAATHDDYSLRS